MSYIAGVDIGNSTTEVCVGEVTDRGNVTFLTSASCPTTGTKGTIENVYSVKNALKLAMSRIGRETSDIDLVRLNEAAPVIGDTAMETLTETVITDSSMIGHNPSTPAGAGQAVGEILLIENISRAVSGTAYILAASSEHSYEEVAAVVNQHNEIDIVGIILQADEAVLVENRIHKEIPIIDEVRRIDRLPDGVPAAIEVALPGQTIRMLSNPYGIATLLRLTADETRTITPIAKSLIGKRSAVVLKTPGGNIHENVLPAGEIYFYGDKNVTISLDEGAEKIMAAAEDAGDIRDISGQPDTNVGNMLSRIRTGMSELDKSDEADIRYHRYPCRRYTGTGPYLRRPCRRDLSGKGSGHCSHGQDTETSHAGDCLKTCDRAGNRCKSRRCRSCYGQSRSPDYTGHKTASCYP